MKRILGEPRVLTIDVEYFGFTEEARQQRVVCSYTNGYERNGVFYVVSQDVVVVQGADYDALMAATDTGKQEGRYRNDDVLAIADRLRK